MLRHEKINYVEFATLNIASTKQFFEDAFRWVFQDYGPEYTAFSDQGLDGGFYQSDKCSIAENGGALIVFYSEDLERTLDKVIQAGGTIVKPIFDFPGGRRFQFTEPGGNEFGVWSDLSA